MFLFQFYHKDDMDWVIKGGPWSFDNALLVFNVIKQGEDPVKVPLVEVDFWIQIHNLPVGYMSEAVGKQLGNFFGSFIQYDSNNNSSIWREFMRLRVRLDVRKPLKRKNKICKKDKTEVVVLCKYEKLGDFCFMCGLLSHTERFCKKKLEVGSAGDVKDRGSWLRAPSRKVAGGGKSKWLREESDSGWENIFGKDEVKARSSGIQKPDIMQSSTHAVSGFGNVVGVATNQGLSVVMGNNLNLMEGNPGTTLVDGPEDDELDGLRLEERKRQRSEAHVYSNMDFDKVNKTTDAVLSHNDCTESHSTYLAKLARQASQSQ